MTADSSTPGDAQARSSFPLLIAVLAVIVACGALWMSYSNATKFAASQERAAVAPPPDPALAEMKQTLASLQQAVQGIEAGQKRQAAQIGDAQQKTSAQQGEQKLISDQLGALSARVNSLESARAESPAQATPAAPSPQRRTKR
ncbi:MULTISPECIES: hypothetical protein [Bradyrhizobium]|uniref:SlyX family protein n=1 Tax=Bradyrhizobium brasilense TaxID=1419277 RepID=A0ABY8JR08_9BRAD|nr:MULTISPECIES: hypothetical protein [Bradyrhizobium]MCP1914415.1 hypothetical protein [Bradyrhizobium elkanii]MCP1831566.1 hypothetical protein [Bradyrhizobium sp. USDA 4545]MCP1850487.1 hypothetical protein [Bradyrhizobium sp. USDA 4541]MCP1924677.1 hypothetical protein [Bradyrhizobium sp. USDA 4532]WFU66765.1 hypothetical protein QA636_15200 [Bradyrhizobium brasilense]